MAGKTKTFEEAIKRLEEIENELSSGENSLEDAMKLYEESVKLIKLCNQKLEKTQLTINKLNSEFNSEVI